MKGNLPFENMIKKIIRIALWLVGVGIVSLIGIFLINLHITTSTKERILTLDQIPIDSKFDAILVLGAGVRQDSPSPILKDRLNQAIDAFQLGSAPVLLMSGDHGQTDYDEVNVMKTYAIKKGIPSDKIFMDHAGFSTYESLYRAKAIFGVKNPLIVTQKYHLYRSLYIAQQLDMTASGLDSSIRPYHGQRYRSLRERIAQVKDFFYCIIKPKPTYLGDTIPLTESGDYTND